MLGRPSPDRQAQQPPRRDSRWLLSLLALLLLLVLSGCYWLKYCRLMRTHIDLLLSMAKKMSDLLEDHQAITPPMMSEFSYPLERARDFARIAGQRYAERLKETDRLRVLNGDLTDFRARVTTLREQGAQVKAILADEER